MKKICGNCFSRISGNVCRKCGHVNVRTSAEYDALPRWGRSSADVTRLGS